MRVAGFLLLAIASAGCVARARPAAVDRPSTTEEMAPADELVRAGCYDCLTEAMAIYGRLASVDGGAAAAARARQTAGLLAIRERELGLLDQGYLAIAREGTDAEDAFLLDVIATLPRRSVGAARAGTDEDIRAVLAVRRNRDEWHARLAAVADRHPLAAVTALAFDCAYGTADGDSLGRSGRTSPFGGTPLVRFTAETCHPTAALAALLDADSRFVEINYFLGIADTVNGDLDGADARFQRALAWRRDWPAVTFALASVAMTAEVFDRAVAFYDRTRLLTGGNPDAELGYVRALSYARRHAEAIEAANRLLAGSWNRGDAYYWRAWNETQLNRDDRAWDDVAEAAKVLFNADVPKLTGILAIRRGELPQARDQFQQAAARSRDDCEIPSLLGGTHLGLESWRPATAALTEAVACLDRRDESLRAEIARLRAAGGRERTVLRREHEIAANERVRVQAWFNLAVAALEMGDVAAARMYAGRVANDERFGDRARALLQRLR